MDVELKRLLAEVARAVLKVCAGDTPQDSCENLPASGGYPITKPGNREGLANKRRPGVVAAVNDALAGVAVLADPIVTLPKHIEPQRGDAVRVWAGDRYETGTVQTICRGTPRKLWVSISRGEGKRAKRVRVESDKAVVVKKYKEGA